MTGDALKVRSGASVGQSASEVRGLIPAGPGGAGDAGKQGRAGIAETNLSSSTLMFPTVELGHQVPATHPLVFNGSNTFLNKRKMYSNFTADLRSATQLQL